MKSIIRQASEVDAVSVAEISVASWQAAYRGIIPDSYLKSLNIESRAQGWRNVLCENHNRVFVHECDNILLGYIAFCPCRDLDAGVGWGELSSVYYLPRHWGHGLANELMEFGLEFMKKAGYEVITLWVLRQNIRAQKFYKKYGFEFDATERAIDRGEFVLDEIRMLRSLTTA